MSFKRGRIGVLVDPTIDRYLTVCPIYEVWVDVKARGCRRKPHDRRATYANHIREKHADVCQRDRSLFADAMLRGERKVAL